MKQTDSVENKQQDIPPDFRIWEAVGNGINEKNGNKVFL